MLNYLIKKVLLMRYFNFKIFVFGLFLLISSISIENINAQNIDSSRYFNPITDDIAKKLPPLEALIDSAIANSPLVKIEELQADYNTYEIKSAKNKWLNHIYLDAEFDAGNWLYRDRNELLTIDWYNYESRRVSYYAGFSVRFPLVDIFDRRNQINLKKKLKEISLVTRQHRIREVKEAVVTTYNELIQQQNLLRISNEYQQYANIYMPIAEMEFKNGEIPASELQRLKDYQTRGEIAFADIVMAFNDAYWRLEEIVGMKFNLINVLN